MPLLVFQILYGVFLFHYAPHKILGASSPVWLLWFLLSLFCWRLMLPIFLRLKMPLIISVILALSAGLVQGIDTSFGLSRTLVFFPAFLFGHLYASSAIEKARNTPLRSMALMGGVVALGLGVLAQIGDFTPLFGRSPYSALPHTVGLSMAIRLILIFFGIVLSICFLSLVPEVPTVHTKIREKSLKIYLWHGFAAVLWWWMIVFLPPVPELLFLPMSLAAAYGLCVVGSRLPSIGYLARIARLP